MLILFEVDVYRYNKKLLNTNTSLITSYLTTLINIYDHLSNEFRKCYTASRWYVFIPFRVPL